MHSPTSGFQMKRPAFNLIRTGARAGRAIYGVRPDERNQINGPPPQSAEIKLIRASLMPPQNGFASGRPCSVRSKRVCSIQPDAAEAKLQNQRAFLASPNFYQLSSRVFVLNRLKPCRVTQARSNNKLFPPPSILFLYHAMLCFQGVILANRTPMKNVSSGLVHNLSRLVACKGKISRGK
jgi:hypothetical protein